MYCKIPRYRYEIGISKIPKNTAIPYRNMNKIRPSLVFGTKSQRVPKSKIMKASIVSKQKFLVSSQFPELLVLGIKLACIITVVECLYIWLYRDDLFQQSSSFQFIEFIQDHIYGACQKQVQDLYRAGLKGNFFFCCF